MAFPTSGPISINTIRTTLGTTSGSLLALSQLVGKSSPHSMDEFYGMVTSQSFSYSGSTVYFGKGAKFGSGLMVSQPATPYFSHVGTWGSLTPGPTTLNSNNWGVQMTIAVASFMRATAGTSAAKVIFEATSVTEPQNKTWWNTLTISKPGYTNPYGFPSSFTFNRSNATISWSAAEKRLHIEFTDYNSNDFYYHLYSRVGCVWTFSV